VAWQSSLLLKQHSLHDNRLHINPSRAAAPHRAFVRSYLLLQTFAIALALASSSHASCYTARYSIRPRPRRTPHAKQPANMGFGDFSTICTKAAIPLCALVGRQEINGGAGIQTNCYSRTIEIANTLIFQAANDFMHILALIMTVVMIIHVRSKFTAVGKLRPHTTRRLHALTQPRPQRNHILLLHLPPSHRHITHSRRRRYSTRIRAISVLCSRPEWPGIRPLHVLIDQRLRWVPAL
jgi:hypothetical protein